MNIENVPTLPTIPTTVDFKRYSLPTGYRQKLTKYRQNACRRLSPLSPLSPEVQEAFFDNGEPLKPATAATAATTVDSKRYFLRQSRDRTRQNPRQNDGAGTGENFCRYHDAFCRYAVGKRTRLKSTTGGIVGTVGTFLKVVF